MLARGIKGVSPLRDIVPFGGFLDRANANGINCVRPVG